MKAFALKAFGILLMLSALALALSRAPDRAPETLVGRWAPPPSDFVDVGGQVVHLRDTGPRDDALPVLLLHGTSASLHTWEGWTKALERQRRVIAIDLPGHGLTGPWTGARADAGYAGDTVARFVLEVMDALKVPRFVAAGNSYGGEIAWRLATLAPGRVAALVLVDAAGPKVEGGRLPLGWYVARAPFVGRITEEVLPRGVVAEGVTTAYGHPERVTSELVDRYFELMLREGNRHALRERLAAAAPGQDEARIAQVTQPTLILWGGRDRLLPPATAEVFRQRIAGSRLVVFPDLGHVPQEEDPAASVVPVREFLGLK